ncbi:MAG: transporter substrate-binding domain-containing protein [Deltaproteobacteria bacterium]|nr:transporter substrate-binding domain-containing protein [Deltaproteobacteria bacterium]
MRLTARALRRAALCGLLLGDGGCRQPPALEVQEDLEAVVINRVEPDGDAMLPWVNTVPGPRRDLSAVRNAGVVRVLVREAAMVGLPRVDSPLLDDRALAGELAKALGVALQLVPVPRGADPVAALREGRADLMAPGWAMAGGGRSGCKASIPVHEVDVVLAVASGLHPLRGLKHLHDAKVGIRADVLWASLSAGLTARLGAGSTLELSGSDMDGEDLLGEIADGRLQAAVVLDSELDTYRRYGDAATLGQRLARDIPLSWLMLEDAVELRPAVDAAVRLYLAGARERANRGGDLRAIRRRGVLRVGMLNNGSSYFIWRGQQLGFQLEFARLFAAGLGLRLEVVVPDTPADMPELLRSGRVDLIPASLGGDPRDADFVYSRPFIFADDVLVQPVESPPITTLDELAGATVHVRGSSVYMTRLREIAVSVPTLKIVSAGEELETEDLIEKVGKKEIAATVSNSVLLGVELAHREDVRATLTLTHGQPMAYGLRADTPNLLAALDGLIEREMQGRAFAQIFDRYFTDARRRSQLKLDPTRAAGTISPYDGLVRRYAKRHGLDWRLVVAQMYQESRFDPRARSRVGAVGLLQIMPRTGMELGVKNLEDPEENVRAGVKYLAAQRDSLEPAIDLRQRLRFALAAYNAGMGHVADARLLARKMGDDPDRWFNNVEKAMLLLQKPEYHRRARYGYCRGEEPVDYVRRIESIYDAYRVEQETMGGRTGSARRRK